MLSMTRSLFYWPPNLHLSESHISLWSCSLFKVYLNWLNQQYIFIGTTYVCFIVYRKPKEMFQKSRHIKHVYVILSLVLMWQQIKQTRFTVSNASAKSKKERMCWSRFHYELFYNDMAQGNPCRWQGTRWCYSEMAHPILQNLVWCFDCI